MSRRQRSQAVTSTAGLMPWQVAEVRVPLFPVSKRVRGMLYSESSVDQTHATTAQNYFFSANGMYDPNITGTGHQPMGFDTMMAYYEQATVLHSRCTVQAYNNSATVPCRVWLSLSPDTTAITDTTEIVENGLVKHVDLNTTGSSKIGVVSLGCDVAKYFGRATKGRGILDDVNLYCTAAANPTEQVYFNITSSGILATSGTYNMTFQAFLSYDVVFWEPRKVVTSIPRGIKESRTSTDFKSADDSDAFGAGGSRVGGDLAECNHPLLSSTDEPLGGGCVLLARVVEQVPKKNHSVSARKGAAPHGVW